MSNRVAILNVFIDAITMSAAIAKIEQFIADKTPRLVATANAEMVMLADEDPEMASILAAASLVVPDGAGVVWAGRHKGHNIPERVAGCDLVQNLFAVSAQKGYRIYLLGSAPGVVEKARDTVQERCPGVNIVGTHDGFFNDLDEALIINEIKTLHPDILLVALGVPKQEKWLSKHLASLNVPVSIGVGGTLDVLAGVMQRAPLWMQRANLEWLFRLLRQPSRALRMLALPRFVFRVIFSSAKPG